MYQPDIEQAFAGHQQKSSQLCFRYLQQDSLVVEIPTIHESTLANIILALLMKAHQQISFQLCFRYLQQDSLVVEIPTIHESTLANIILALLSLSAARQTSGITPYNTLKKIKTRDQGTFNFQIINYNLFSKNLYFTLNLQLLSTFKLSNLR